MGKCKRSPRGEHDWQMRSVEHGCMPESLFAHYECVRCGREDHCRVGRPEFERDTLKAIEAAEMELAFRAPAYGEPPEGD